MSHRNARLTVHGRRLLVHRVRELGMPVSHVAKAMGISRQCAHRWVARFDAEGDAGLVDRSSRPHRTPRRTHPDVEAQVVAARLEHRRGPDWLGPELGVPPRTVTRILRRHHIPRLVECDPLTGQVIRASKTTAVRYERDRPGELVHMDVKKIGRIPDGGGWRAHGREMGSSSERKKTKVGYDYVHSLVDDHSRLAYSGILGDERAVTVAAFYERAIAYFADRGIERIERLMTDNAWNYPARPRAALAPRSAPDPPPVHQARQGRATQPHPPDRVGLPAGLHHQRRTRRGSATMARLLQPPTATLRHRRPPTDQPPVTKVTAGHI